MSDRVGQPKTQHTKANSLVSKAILQVIREVKDKQLSATCKANALAAAKPASSSRVPLHPPGEICVARRASSAQERRSGVLTVRRPPPGGFASAQVSSLPCDGPIRIRLQCRGGPGSDA